MLERLVELEVRVAAVAAALHLRGPRGREIASARLRDSHRDVRRAALVVTIAQTLRAGRGP